ncbi:FadR family transcriptional regulator [Lachnospiraceae bacterium ZAX-1]
MEQSERSYDKVVGYIRQEIRQGSLRRGERLPPERELAELIGVSRNSVREALRTLSLMGFISSVQGAGNFVTCDFEKNLTETLNMMLLLGETNALQLSQLRRALESETVRLAVGRIMPKQIEKLGELARKMREEPNREKSVQYDQEFHSILCIASGNKLIQSLFDAMLSTINNFISTMHMRIMQDPIQREALHTAHTKLVEALCERDEKKAMSAIFEHFEVVDNSLQSM